MMNRLIDNDWDELEKWLKMIPIPLKPGLYPIDAKEDTASEISNQQM